MRVVRLGGITFNNVKDANDIAWAVTDIDGWHGNTDVRLSQFDRSAAHGVVIATAHYSGRPLILAGVGAPLPPTGVWRTAATRLAGAMDLLATPGLLEVDEGALKLQMEVHLAGRVRVAPPANILEFEVPLLAADPRKYAQVESDVEITIAGAGTSQGGTANSLGTTETAPVVEIEGPAVNPRLLHGPTGRFIRFMRTLSAGQTLTVDFRRRTAVLTPGGTEVYGDIDPASRWWELSPGANALTYSRSSGASASTATVAWRDAYH